MLNKSLTGFGLLSNAATIAGLWVSYLSAPQSAQEHLAHLLIWCGGIASAAAYLFLAYIVLRPSSKPLDNFRDPRWTVISGVNYKDTLVVIDGMQFYDCSFENVTLRFDGTGPTEMIRCTTNGQLSVESDHPIARACFHLQEILSAFPGQVHFSVYDQGGHRRPSALRITERK